MSGTVAAHTDLQTLASVWFRQNMFTSAGGEALIYLRDPAGDIPALTKIFKGRGWIFTAQPAGQIINGLAGYRASITPTD